MKKVLKEEFITTNWAGGTTSQIFIDPADACVSEKNFNFRISSATCDLDKSDFTPYDDFVRYITPLDGDLKLINGESEIKLSPFEVYFFDGADNVTSYGKVRDYNLIIRKGFAGSMYSKKLENSSYNIVSNGKKLIIFNFKGDLSYDYGESSNIFDKFSALILEDKEDITIFGVGKILICEINL